MIYQSYIKPFCDFLIAISLLLLLSPIIIVITILLFITNKGKVFFLQQRPGYKSKPFFIIKFRTMSEALNDKGKLLSDDSRLTNIGRIVRSLSLDEILQLVNVLKGDMSLVGPRPLLMEYLSRYSPKQARRHEVKPGISGWAQVNGRNAISWHEKFELDVWYVDNINFFIDLKILLLTIVKVFKTEGISPNGRLFMEVFRGNEDKKE